MLYLLEGLGFAFLAYYVSKYSGWKSALMVFSAILVCASAFDPLLYSVGFVWTASNLIQSVFINGIVYLFALSGVILEKWMSLPSSDNVSIS
jgi:uncharacterized membrane protein